jgi:hypothetical protein
MVAAFRRSRKTPNNNIATKNDKSTNAYRSDDGFGIVSHYSAIVSCESPTSLAAAGTVKD